jgi:16S rRNA (cytosine1402-N4)-methyltransferase
MRHIPVLLQEIMDGLKVPQGGVYIDCNLGDAGHVEEVLKTTGGNVTVIGFDLDADAIERATKNIAAVSSMKDIHLFRKNFRTISNTLSEAGIYKGEPVADAILFDLGISSYEIDESGRGFSFQKDEPLSMTFGTSVDHSFTAYDIVNTWDEENIADIIYAYGEDKYSRRIAKAIVQNRENLKKSSADSQNDKTRAVLDIEEGKGGIQTSAQLADIIKMSYPSFARHGKIHPATRTFQALRIAVNDELRALEDALPQAIEVLKVGGRLAVISFHSLEDRIVKRFFKQLAEEGKIKSITKKPIVPSDEEIKRNPRSRSSKLRIIEKLH